MAMVATLLQPQHEWVKMVTVIVTDVIFASCQPPQSLTHSVQVLVRISGAGHSVPHSCHTPPHYAAVRKRPPSDKLNTPTKFQKHQSVPDSLVQTSFKELFITNRKVSLQLLYEISLSDFCVFTR